jgi:hypothetical protein
LGGGFSLWELLTRDFLSVFFFFFFPFLLLWQVSGFCRNLLFYFCGFVMFCVGRVASWLACGHLFVVIKKKLSYSFSFSSNWGGGGDPSYCLDKNFLFNYLIFIYFFPFGVLFWFVFKTACSQLPPRELLF